MTWHPDALAKQASTYYCKAIYHQTRRGAGSQDVSYHTAECRSIVGGSKYGTTITPVESGDHVFMIGVAPCRFCKTTPEQVRASTGPPPR